MDRLNVPPLMRAIVAAIIAEPGLTAREVARRVYSGRDEPTEPRLNVIVTISACRRKLREAGIEITSGLGKKAGYRLIECGPDAATPAGTAEGLPAGRGTNARDAG